MVGFDIGEGDVEVGVWCGDMTAAAMVVGGKLQ